MAYENGRLLTVKKEDGSFMAGAKHDIKYLIEDQISFYRWADFQKLQIMLGYDLSFNDMFERHNKAYSLLNEVKFADAACEIRSVMECIKNMSAVRIPTSIKLCALFINREDEDRRSISNSRVEQKHNDWAEAGYDINSFFQLALHSIPGFIKAYEQSIPGISTPETEN